VLAALRARRAYSGPGRGDGHKIGLAVEGGGMRGVVSGELLCALEDLGLPATAFDGVYGCSSGATNGAYFIAGDSWYPLSIYYDDLPTHEFVDFRRAATSNVLNLEYAFETIRNFERRS
jgi:predicted patatin/cPLA2 family phospholipase